MTSAASRCLALVLVACSCSSEGADPGDASTGCSADCLPGWWTEVVFDGCNTICLLVSDAPECAAPDCQHMKAHELEDSGVHVKLNVAHSASRRSFTMVTAQVESWAIEPPCRLTLGDGAGTEFACVGDDVIDFVGANDWRRAEDQLGSALRAAAEGPSGQSYTY